MASMLFPIHDREGRRGYIDAEGSVVVPLIYDADGIMGYFWTDRARIYDWDKKRGDPSAISAVRRVQRRSGLGDE
jgi:hypothetical protein